VFRRRSSKRYLPGFIRLTTRVPWLTAALAIVLAVAALWYTARTLEFETSRDALTSSQARYAQLQQEINHEFNKIDYLIVAVEPPNPELGRQFVEALAARLRADTQHFEQIIEKIDTSSLDGKKLLYLTADELRSLHQRLEDSQDFLATLSASPGLGQLLTAINQEISKALVAHITGGLLGLSSPTASPSEPASAEALDISFLTALFTEMERAIAEPKTYYFRSPWGQFFLKDGDVFSETEYLTSKHDRFFFVLVDDKTTPGSMIKHAVAVRALRAHVAAVLKGFPAVRAGVTGDDALNTDEMLTAQHDTLLASVIALVGVALLFIVAFRQIVRPLLVVVMLVVGLCWTMGFTALTVGHLNILSVAFLPILIGLGIDFGIHLVARYGEERTRHVDFGTALQAAYLYTGPGVTAAALTTAVAFYAVMLTNFRGLIELGLIAGSGMVLCLLASFTVLPALLALAERRRHVPAGVWKPLTHDPLAFLTRFPRTLLSVLVLLTLAGAVFVPLPRFDYNLLNLQAHGTESVVWEYRLLEESGRSSWYALGIADSLPELRRKKAQFAALPAVDRVESLASVIPENQDERLVLVRELTPLVSGVSGDWEHPEAVDLDEVRLMLQKIRFKLQRQPSDWDPTKRPSEEQLTAARNALLALQSRMEATPPAMVRSALDTFQRALMDDFATKLGVLRRNTHPTDPITLREVPERLRQRFVSRNGRYLLQIFARGNIRDREPMREFVTQLQSVDADVTGFPVTAYYAIRQMQHGYTYGGVYAFVAITGIVLLLFRRLRPTALALVPMLFGGLWTMACMDLFDLQLNMANLIILPLYLGIAVDNGIHLVHRIQEDPEGAAAPLTRSTGKAIVLSSLTSIVGFGSLMVARHAGIFSLGLLTAVSVACALLATLVVLPLAARLFPPGPPPSSQADTPSTAVMSKASSS
jgi:hopanoid biosynthesis associated RND transporter like protein HpnN